MNLKIMKVERNVRQCGRLKKPSRGKKRHLKKGTRMYTIAKEKR